MRCRICGEDGCGPDERAARSQRDLDSVRRALAARQSAGSDDPETGDAVAATMAVALDSIASEVEVALAEVRAALESLMVVAITDGAQTVGDIRHGIERVEDLMADLGRRCAGATMRKATDRGSGG